MKYGFSGILGLFILLAAGSASATPGGVSGGGGDIYSAEFKRIARQLTATMASHGIAQVGNVTTTRLRELIEQTSVETTFKTLRIDQIRKDAINYPSEKKIVLSLVNWPYVRSGESKRQIVLHEFFGIARIDDSQYQQSNLVLTRLQAYLQAQDDAETLRKLQGDLRMWTTFVLPITIDFVHQKTPEAACARIGFFSGAFEYGIFEEIRQVAMNGSEARQNELTKLNSEMEDQALSMTSYCDDSDIEEIDHAVAVGDKNAETQLIQGLIANMNRTAKIIGN